MDSTELRGSDPRMPADRPDDGQRTPSKGSQRCDVVKRLKDLIAVVEISANVADSEHWVMALYRLELECHRARTHDTAFD